MLEGYYIKKIGQNKGAPRVWLEGTQTERAGFAAGQRYNIEVKGQTIVLQANKDGSRVVSSKKSGEKKLPVIDLNSRELLAIFDGMSSVRIAVKKGEIYLVPLASEIKKQERFKRLKHKLENGEPLLMGSLSHGGGILSHAIHAGFKEAGMAAELGFVNEIRGELLEHAAIHNDDWTENTQIYAASMQELAFDERGLANIPRVEAMSMGLPCSGASISGKSKRGLVNAEAHPEVGHLVVAALVILSKANPAICIFENVVPYSNSASADILRNQLRDMGYVTHERILNGKEWGALENRTRWCMVAVTQGIEFNFDQLMPPDVQARKLSEVLEEFSDDDPRWSKMEGLKAKEVRDKAAGKGFHMQVFSGDDDHINTITKGYSKIRSTDSKIKCDNNPELLRQLTAVEHARVKGIPEHLIEGLCSTTSHEVLGQSIVYSPFKDLGQHIGNALNRLSGMPEIALPNRATVVSVTDDDGVDHIADLANEVVATLRFANDNGGRYSGPIVAVDGNVQIQDIGRNEGVVHLVNQLDKTPKLGQSIKIAYDKGRGAVDAREKQQFSLGL